MKTLLIAAGAVMLAAVPAAAQPPRGGGFGGMQGDLTREQAEQAVKAQIERLDFNHDGMITNQEIEKAIDMASTYGAPPQVADLLHGLMKEFGKDGRIVVADLVKARMVQFDAADTNHDGKLSPEERQAAFAAMRAAREGGSGGAPIVAAPPAAPKK
jgi:hypothetical protein